MKRTNQHRLYRETQDDYWAARSRRARRVLALRRARNVVLTLIVIAALIAGAGYAVHRADPRLHVPGYGSGARYSSSGINTARQGSR